MVHKWGRWGSAPRRATPSTTGRSAKASHPFEHHFCRHIPESDRLRSKLHAVRAPLLPMLRLTQSHNPTPCRGCETAALRSAVGWAAIGRQPPPTTSEWGRIPHTASRRSELGDHQCHRHRWSRKLRSRANPAEPGTTGFVPCPSAPLRKTISAGGPEFRPNPTFCETGSDRLLADRRRTSRPLLRPPGSTLVRPSSRLAAQRHPDHTHNRDTCRDECCHTC